MQINTRTYYYLTLAILVMLMSLWLDEAFRKTNPWILTYPYELVKITLHTTIAYKLAKYLARVFRRTKFLRKITYKSVFLTLFILLNLFIITQYVSRTISVQLVNSETRDKLASKLKRTENAGTGYNGINLTLPEYNEIKNYTNLPKLPKESNSISVSDTYGFQDFSRVVEFNVPPNFNIERYYRDSSLTEDMEVMDRILDKVRGEWIILDSTKYKRIKWEVGET